MKKVIVGNNKIEYSDFKDYKNEVFEVITYDGNSKKLSFIIEENKLVVSVEVTQLMTTNSNLEVTIKGNRVLYEKACRVAVKIAKDVFNLVNVTAIFVYD